MNFGCTGSLLLPYLVVAGGGYSFAASRLLLGVGLLWSTGSRAPGFSSCGPRAQLLRGVWNLPSSRTETMSPALAAGFCNHQTHPGSPESVNFGFSLSLFFSGKNMAKKKIRQKHSDIFLQRLIFRVINLKMQPESHLHENHFRAPYLFFRDPYFKSSVLLSQGWEFGASKSKFLISIQAILKFNRF